MSRKWIQIVLAIAFVLAAIRLVVVLRQRKGPALVSPTANQSAPPLNAEYYVTPKKLHAYDLKSAGELTQQPEWMKEGYRYTYYPFNSATKQAALGEDAGVLGPIQKIQITQVVEQPTPGKSKSRQVVAVFSFGDKTYAVPVGVKSDREYQIYADEMFYYQDPHKLYDFWPKEIWDAIDQHKILKGMDELQASMAVGMGEPHRGETEDQKVVIYPNGGRRVTVTYVNGKAAGIVLAQ